MRLQDADADAAIDNFRRDSSAASASHAPEQANGRSSQGSQVCTHTVSTLRLIELMTCHPWHQQHGSAE